MFLSKSEGAIDAPLVGGIHLQSLRTGHRRGHLGTHQRPGARADVGPAGADPLRSVGTPRRRPSRCREWPGRRPRSGPVLPRLATSSRSRPRDRPRRHHLGKDLCGQFEPTQQFTRPAVAGRVEALGRGGVGEFDHPAAAQQPVKVIGDQQQPPWPDRAVRGGRASWPAVGTAY